jgi:hypothetical protein
MGLSVLGIFMKEPVTKLEPVLELRKNYFRIPWNFDEGGLKYVWMMAFSRRYRRARPGDPDHVAPPYLAERDGRVKPSHDGSV